MVGRDNGSDEIRIKPAALAGLLLALFGGNLAITSFSTSQEVVRPDPFTGTDGMNMRQQLQRQLDEHLERIERLERKMVQCAKCLTEHGG